MSRVAVSVRPLRSSSAAHQASRRRISCRPPSSARSWPSSDSGNVRWSADRRHGSRANDHPHPCGVMVTWLVLFMAQVWFAASGRVRLHIRLGPWVMGFGIVLVAVALLAISEGFAARLAAGDVFRAQRWLFGTLRDVVFFVPFLVAGWVYRRRPEIHKRVMLVATTIIVLPAVSRMTFLGFPVALWKFMLVWPLPVYLAMAHDFRARRMVHPVYLIGIAAMLTMRLVLPLSTSVPGKPWPLTSQRSIKHRQAKPDDGVPFPEPAGRSWREGDSPS